jgi:integrase
VNLLRRRIATHLLDAGEPIDFVQDHLGHRSIESSLVYARVSDRRRRKAISRLERSRESAVPT